MDEVLVEVAAALTPVLAATGAAAGQAIAEQGGQRLAASASPILSAIRRRLSGGNSGEGEVADALAEALASGEIDRAALETFLADQRSVTDQRSSINIGSQTAETINNIRGDYHA